MSRPQADKRNAFSGLHFHKTYFISTRQNFSNPLACSEIASMLQINGRAIFQKERVDKGYRENRRRDSRGVQDAGCQPRKLLQRKVTTGKQGKRGPQGSQVLSIPEVTK